MLVRVCAKLGSVNIDKSTSQAELMLLTERATRARLARALPFHKEGLRGMLLFFLFPSMLFGFRVGLLITAAVAGAIGATLVFGNQEVGAMIVRSYLVVGAITSVGVALSIFLQERKKVARLRSFLKPDAKLALKAGVLTPERQKMQLDYKESGGFTAYYDVCVQQRGVYGFLVELDSYGWAQKLCTSEGDDACFFSWGAGQKPSQAVALLRLDVGVHRLEMRVSSEKRKKGKNASSRPELYLTQLTRIA